VATGASFWLRLLSLMLTPGMHAVGRRLTVDGLHLARRQQGSFGAYFNSQIFFSTSYFPYCLPKLEGHNSRPPCEDNSKRIGTCSLFLMILYNSIPNCKYFLDFGKFMPRSNLLVRFFSMGINNGHHPRGRARYRTLNVYWKQQGWISTMPPTSAYPSQSND
jgi:hypothetical protein